MEKERIDILLVEKGLFESREKAKRAIMAGCVYIDEEKIDKPGALVARKSNIIVRTDPNPYVSRGGLKLEKAIADFGISLNEKVCIDVGASTGGFTDCMLKNGASIVYAIDVGYGQLDYRLRTDERVIVMERRNIRYVEKHEIKHDAVFASIDVSFISLKTVLPVVKSLMAKDHEVVCLIKPQFEAGREKVGKKGVVRDKEVHKDVVFSILSFAKNIEYGVCGVTYSPIKGPSGNIEFLAYLKSNCIKENNDLWKIADSVVVDAYLNL